MSYTGRADENGICKCIDEQTRGHTVGGGAPGTAPGKALGDREALSPSRQVLCLLVRHTTKITGEYGRAWAQTDKTRMLSAELILRSEVTR
jgi:hypothetical protein